METRPAPHAALAASALNRLPSALLQHEIVARLSDKVMRGVCQLLREHFDGERTALRITVPATDREDSYDCMRCLGKVLARLPKVQTVTRHSPASTLAAPITHFCLSALTTLPSLTSLDITNVWLSDVAALQLLSRLKHLSLKNCMSSARLNGLARDDYLTDFSTAAHCPLRIPDLSACAALTTLLIRGQCCDDRVGLNSLQSLVGCSRLQHLDSTSAFKSESVLDVPPLACCSRLMSLTLDNNDRLVNVSALAMCPELHELHLNACVPSDINFLTGLTALRTLGLSQWACDLVALRDRRQLTHLDLSYSHAISDLTLLQRGHHLAHLDLSFTFDVVTDLRPLALCTNLTTLVLTGCDDAADYSPLAACRRLERLVVGEAKLVELFECLAILPPDCKVL